MTHDPRAPLNVNDHRRTTVVWQELAERQRATARRVLALIEPHADVAASIAQAVELLRSEVGE